MKLDLSCRREIPTLFASGTLRRHMGSRWGHRDGSPQRGEGNAGQNMGLKENPPESPFGKGGQNDGTFVNLQTPPFLRPFSVPSFRPWNHPTLTPLSLAPLDLPIGPSNFPTLRLSDL